MRILLDRSDRLHSSRCSGSGKLHRHRSRTPAAAGGARDAGAEVALRPLKPAEIETLRLQDRSCHAVSVTRLNRLWVRFRMAHAWISIRRIVGRRAYPEL